MNLPQGPILEKLVASFCDERKRAASARKDREIIWKTARNQYKGICTSGNNSQYEKGETLDSPLTTFRESLDDKRSTVVPNITRPYTNAGAARVADILLPTGKMPFLFRTTPVSDLQTVLDVLKEYPDMLQNVMEALPDVAQKIQDEQSAKAATERAFNIVKDWLKESKWAGVVRQQLLEASVVGVGIIKGPFPKERRISKDVSKILDIINYSQDELTAKLVRQELELMLFYTPQIECIKVENCYPDPDCGTDIQNGKFFYEEITEVTRRQLINLMKDPSYDTEAIKLALNEGPQNDEFTSNRKSKRSYSLWLRTGIVEWKEEDDTEVVLGFHVVTMLNNRIIKCSPYPLETELFPYWVLRWEPRDNSWDGIGIPEQMETPQRGVTATTRALMDNMGYSVGPQVLELDGLIEPVDGNDSELRPYKRWKVKSALPGVDAMTEAKSAMAFLEFPNYLNTIMPVIQFWLKMAEDTTGLSLLLQGQAVTDAVGVSQQLMNNSTTNLRLIVKEWDDKVCYPLLTALYEWVQIYGPEDAKGDAVVEPLGSTTLIVKELQQQALLQISQQVLQPVYGVSPQKWMKTYLEGFQIDIENLALTEEERASLEQAAQQPDPKVLAAQVEAQAEVYKADLRKEVDTLKLALEAQFKRLSLEQAQAAIQLKSDTALVQKEMEVQQKEKAIVPSSRSQGVDTDVEATDVDAALQSLGLV